MENNTNIMLIVIILVCCSCISASIGFALFNNTTTTTVAPTTESTTTTTVAPTTTAAPTILQKPIVIDRGYTDRPYGWYNAEGLGCYNYCRTVGDGSNAYFSCMSVDPNGSTKSPNIYSERGKYSADSLASKKC